LKFCYKISCKPGPFPRPLGDYALNFPKKLVKPFAAPPAGYNAAGWPGVSVDDTTSKTEVYVQPNPAPANPINEADGSVSVEVCFVVKNPKPKPAAGQIDVSLDLKQVLAGGRMRWDPQDFEGAKPGLINRVKPMLGPLAEATPGVDRETLALIAAYEGWKLGAMVSQGRFSAEGLLALAPVDFPDELVEVGDVLAIDEAPIDDVVTELPPA
jgi:hypothetical protein